MTELKNVRKSRQQPALHCVLLTAPSFNRTESLCRAVLKVMYKWLYKNQKPTSAKQSERWMISVQTACKATQTDCHEGTWLSVYLNDVVNPCNCLHCQYQRCAASVPVSVSPLCVNQPLLLKPFATKSAPIRTRECVQLVPGCFAYSNRAVCCCDIRCRAVPKVCVNACVIPRMFQHPN